MDALPRSVAFVEVGETVRYVARGQPPRAAIVGHVHPDGHTCDLVVLMDGDGGELSRQAWALGHSITRARLDVPYRGHKPDDARTWEFPPAPRDRLVLQ